MAKEKKGGAISKKTLALVQTAILAALMLILNFTGIGYFKIGVFSLTVMMAPVIIGAITVGKTAGAVLGAVFGLTVILLPETQLFMSVNLPLTIMLCVGLRGLLLGFLCGLTFEGFKKIDKTRLWSFIATGLLASLLNTVITIGGIALIFGSNPTVLEALGMSGFGKMEVFAAFMSLVGVQAIIEAFLCTFTAVTVAKPVTVYINKN
ncbi:MAG: ECF transporter S component [Oscillospiraceae bacterium]|jgi:uncharacterized membrane protein|nr:ECF transporter S component [Oscillospiraceae bacterium]